MKQKRALLIGPFPPPIGGDTIFTLNVFRSVYWKRAGIELERIDTSPGDRVRLPDERVSARDVLRGFRIFAQVLGKLPRSRTILLWANCRFVCIMAPPIIAASLVMRRPVVIKAFGAMLAERIAVMGPIRRRLTILMLNKAAWLLPETRKLTEDLVEIAGIDPARVVRFPNYLPDADIPPDYRKKRFAGSCVFMGQIKREKGVFDIIEALGGHAALRCDFYGPIVDRDRDAFMEAISRCGACAYRGVAEPEKVIETIGAYDALLLPSYHPGEGYPAVVLQAFAAGVPVVVSDWKSIPEIVEDGVTGVLVPPRSPARIREALERLAADGARYESIAARAFSSVRDFSEKAVVNDILVAKVAELLS